MEPSHPPNGTDAPWSRWRVPCSECFLAGSIDEGGTVASRRRAGPSRHGLAGARLLSPRTTSRCGTDRQGRFVIWRQSERKRLEAKLQQRKQTLRARMHQPVAQVGERLTWVLRGYYLNLWRGGPRGAGEPGEPEPLPATADGLLAACAHKAQRAGTLGGRAEATTGRALHPPSGNSASLSASEL